MVHISSAEERNMYKKKLAWDNTKSALQELQEALLCNLCKKLSDAPMKYGICGHFFCKTCIPGKNLCPTCGIPSTPSEITPDRIIQNIITGWKQISDTVGYKSGGDVSPEKTSSDMKIDSEIADSKRGNTKRSSGRVSNTTAKRTENPNCEDKNKRTRNSRTKLSDAQNCSPVRNEKPTARHSAPAAQQFSPARNEKPIVRHSATAAQQSSHRNKKSTGRHCTSKEINKRNAKGETQLHVACIKGKTEQVKNFLEAGANPNTKDNAGWTPLLEAVNHGFMDIIELLLKHGAMVNVPGYENITPLHEAVMSGRVDVMKLLLMYGADPDAISIIGLTPRDLAQTDEMKEILKAATVSPVLSPSVEWKGPSMDPECVAVLGCNLDKQQQKQLATVTQQLKLKVLYSYSPSVTHIIVPADATNVCPSNKTVLQGILQGKWIINTDWLSLCAKTGTLVDPEDFEVRGTNCFPNSEAPKRSRINAQLQRPSIFNGCHIFLAGMDLTFLRDNCKLTKGDIMTLIRNGDGEVLSREPDAEGIPAKEQTVPYHARRDGALAKCSHYVIFKPGRDEPKLKYNMKHIKSLPLTWFFECIETFTLKDPN